MRSVLVAALLALPTLAHAHIYLTQPVGRGEAPNGDPQKNRHCGVAGRMGARVTTFTPGATVMINFRETINHPGWYRISFQPEGEIFRIPPASNGPMAGGGVSNYPTEDRTGMVDETGAIVLQDRILDDGALVQKSIAVTLPNMECTNCTLQVMSVMTAGATYNPANGGSLYFQCADITLAANAPDAGVPVTTDDASVDEPGNNNPVGFEPGIVSGGCSAGGLAGWPALLAVGGLVVRRRRRRA